MSPEGFGDQTIALLMQIPLAGVVVLVVAVFLWFLRDWAKSERESRAAETKAERESRAAETDAERKARATELAAMRDYISVQNELFLQSIKDIRDQHGVSMARIADEMKLVAERVSQLSGIIVAHDSAMKERRVIGER